MHKESHFATGNEGIHVFLGTMVVFACFSLSCELQELLFVWFKVPRYPAFESKKTKTASWSKNLPFQIIGSTLFAIFYSSIGVTFAPLAYPESFFRIGTALALYDLAIYWIHRAQHSFSKLVYSHSKHHRCAMYCHDVINLHHVESIGNGLGFLIGHGLLALSIWEIWIMMALALVHGSLVHSGRVSDTPGYTHNASSRVCLCFVVTALAKVLPWLDSMEGILVGSRFHGVHHALHRDNYAVVFTFWDALFSTENKTDNAHSRLWRASPPACQQTSSS